MEPLWNQTPLPWVNLKEYEVMLYGNDAVRRVMWDQGNGLFFTDCTRPEQNAVCSREQIHVWRDKVVDN